MASVGTFVTQCEWICTRDCLFTQRQSSSGWAGVWLRRSQSPEFLGTQGITSSEGATSSSSQTMTPASLLLLCSHNGLLLVCVPYSQQLFLVPLHSLESSPNLPSTWATTLPASDLHVVPFFQEVLPTPSPPTAWGTPSLGSRGILCCL